jgi:hypothetical protein
MPGCAYDSQVVAEHGEAAAAILRVARRMREASHNCKVGAARRRNSGCGRKVVAEVADLAEAFCHAEMALRTEVQHLFGIWPVDDQPAPAWPTDAKAQPPAPTPSPDRPPAARSGSPLALFDLESS